MTSFKVSNSLQNDVSNKSYSAAAKKSDTFAKLLQTEQSKINISKHAQQRLDSRNLNLKQEDMNQLSTAMDELKDKGSKESLLVYKNMGIIANVQNRTIITAMDMNELGTVTNIDSTKFIK
ncbi:flagellar protein [Liquorilactobacillus sicerae]|uniref:flagellar protein n=1 Tax=Liquorilactobacillus sicerae TaxID=1416943 RepID=UPI002480AE30|nr:flagellar protein [Liquorilactobacillus sicerae]